MVRAQRVNGKNYVYLMLWVLKTHNKQEYVLDQSDYNGNAT